MARKPRSIGVPPPVAARTEFKCLVFTDLHVSARTLDRAIRVLREVGEHAEARKAMIVCLGDFWDLRGVLNVRQVDAVLREIEQWSRPAVFIPGNHDQVTLDGLIHGIRIFSPFPSIRIADELILDELHELAFVPWRELDNAQEEIFSRIPAGWTVFGHAEVTGAIANSGKPAAGKVGLTTIETRARACYLGHYHKRQLLGDRTYYIGSPFEMDFGERNEPHGIALITNEQVAPTFFDIGNEFPKHFVLDWPFAAKDAAEIRAMDIVEARAPLSVLDSTEFDTVLAKVKAEDVRRIPTPERSAVEKAPHFALTLDGALTEFVAQQSAEADVHDQDLVEDVSDEQLLALGRELLGLVPDAKVIVPAGHDVRFTKAVITDFMAVRGQLIIPLEKRGLVLLRGRQGVGKTSIVDAIFWALYGSTSPRKAGVQNAGLKADEVVNDAAERTTVSVSFTIDDKPATVHRTKKRGKSPEIVIEYEGAPPAGISDQQLHVQHLIGLSHELGRLCVYLGQGAVANFLTDGDKRRKEILSTAFNLGACTEALKLVRAKLKDIVVRHERVKLEISSDQRALAALKETDYTSVINEFEERRTAAKHGASQAGEQAKQLVGTIDEALAQEANWLSTKEQHNAHLGTLMKSFGQVVAGAVPPEKIQRIGALQAERGLLERDRAKVTQELTRMIESRGNQTAVCAACKRPLDAPAVEGHILDLELKVRQFDQGIKSCETQVRAINTDIAEAESRIGERRASIEAEIEASREALAKCDAAMNQFTRLRENRKSAQEKLGEARARWLHHDGEINPWAAKQKEHEQRIGSLEATIARHETDLVTVGKERNSYGFWEQGFSQSGIPVLVLRLAIHELQTYANAFMSRLSEGRIWSSLRIDGEDLVIDFFKRGNDGVVRERSYLQLSGGERRCAELAFSPFALSEMIFARTGVRIGTLIIDEVTTHLGAEEKTIVCRILRELDRETVLVIDHDVTVRGEFDNTLEVTAAPDGRLTLERV